MLEEKQTVNIVSSAASATGAAIAVSVAMAPLTSGASATVAAVIAVAATIPIIGMSCVERGRLDDLEEVLDMAKNNVKGE